jgi:DNA-binding SARP family transcriptional activator
MYSRAFPDLLSMIAAAVGSADLPIHMIRMIPPENAERTLRASRTYLDSAEWAILGSRLLGEDQFDAFVERKGRPICRVRMFGGLEVKVGDRPVRERDWKKRKARTVFAMLVLNRGQEISRDQLLDHVWPDLPEDRAKNNFYVAWSSMKGALMGAESKAGPCPYIDGTAGRCRIIRDALRSDIDEFEELLAAGREGDTAGDGDKAIASYERLSAVYRGELLPGDLYDDWFAPLRDRYRFDFVAAMLRLVELYLERDDPCSALVFARRALGVDPTREDLYQATLRCQIAAGQRSAAVETFVQCKTQLAEELGLDPSAETVALYQQILVMEDVPRHDDYGVNR